MVSGMSSSPFSAELAAEAAQDLRPRTERADLLTEPLGLEEAAAVLALLLTDLRPRTDNACLLEALAVSLVSKPSTARASLSCCDFPPPLKVGGLDFAVLSQVSATPLGISAIGFSHS